MEKIRKESTRAIVPLRSYLCRCGAWHLTSRGYSENEMKQYVHTIESLRTILKKLKAENGALKSNTHNEYMKTSKVEERMMLLKKEIEDKDKLIYAHRKNVSELIGRLLQADNKNNSQAA